MSKISFTVRTPRHISTSSGPPLTKEAVAQASAEKPAGLLCFVQQPYGLVHIVLEFPQTYRINNLIFKNQTSAFLTVLAGSSADYEAMRVSDNPVQYLSELATLIPETQLCTLQQYALPLNHQPGTVNSPLHKIKAFPAAKYNRYVSSRAYKFVVLQLRAFPDAHQRRVGCSWCEVYGAALGEDDSAEHAMLAMAATKASAAAASMGDEEWTKAASGSMEEEDAWMEPLGGPSTKLSGLASFKSTGAAERALAADVARAPPKPSPAAAASHAARPILARNATSLSGLRDEIGLDASSAHAAAAASSKPPPVCSDHPSATLASRFDRRQQPPRQYFVCTHKDQQGKSCDKKIFQD